MPEIDTGDILKEPSVRDQRARGVSIGIADPINFGITIGCPGRIAQNRGRSANHSEKCRGRVEMLILEKEPDRFAKTMARLVEKQIEKHEDVMTKDKEQARTTKSKRR